MLAPLDAGGLVPYMLVAREGKHSLWEYKSQGVQWFSDELRIRLGTLIMLVLLLARRAVGLTDLVTIEK